MTDPSKIKPTHTQRAACVYVRQSTPGQVEHNRESTARQYALADRACQLGWPKEQVMIIDEDLGLSGSARTFRERRDHIFRLKNLCSICAPLTGTLEQAIGNRVLAIAFS